MSERLTENLQENSQKKPTPLQKSGVGQKTLVSLRIA
jgi:hypothetical protein